MNQKEFEKIDRIDSAVRKAGIKVDSIDIQDYRENYSIRFVINKELKDEKQ